MTNKQLQKRNSKTFFKFSNKKTKLYTKRCTVEYYCHFPL